MRIISKSSDYYDSCMKYGIDASCVYVRETQVFKGDIGKPDNEYEKAQAITNKIIDGDNIRPHWYRNYSLDCQFDKARIGKTLIIVFCGKIYPCLEIKVHPKGEFWRTYGIESHFCYTWDQVASVFREHLSKAEQSRFFEPTKRRRRYKLAWWHKDHKIEEIKAFFEATGASSPALMNYHHEAEVPIAMLDLSSSHLTFNPILKDVQFFRIMDTAAAYQELSMFVNGILGGKSPKTIEVSNDVKIAKRGFDEWSFRKEPGKKRKL